MGIEVLLMSDVADLGSEGDVVTVSEGYARNRLFPGKLAALVTPATRRRLEKMRRDREAARKAADGAARELATKLEKVSCTIPVKVGEDEKLYGSVTSADIAEALAAQGFQMEKHQVELAEPIRELGVFDVQIRISPELRAPVKVWVVEE